MPVIVVVGAQWGDEAKGKIVDCLAEKSSAVARYNGGDNAGHTVINRYGTFKVRLVPNGFSSPSSLCVIGPGVVVNLETLQQEIASIERSGLELKSRLWVSPRCHVVMPYHPMLESIYEQAKGKGRTGTTGRGMGPVYADKVSYNGIRMFDLADRDKLIEKINIQLAVKNCLFDSFGMQTLQASQVADKILQVYAEVQAVVREPFGLLQNILADGQTLLLEGAQGALLDNVWGTYPFCTASETLAGGASAGLGIASRWISRVVGVTKAYTSRVGAGPMPTELLDETGETLRREGQEYGTVTGRPRRCGWLDAEALRFSCQLNGVTDLALTKLDVLDKLPTIKVCIAYRTAGADSPSTSFQNRHYWEGNAEWLETCQPVYEEMPGWQRATRAVRRFADLPLQAQSFVRRVEELAQTPVSMVSVGPDREETIQL
jgi:adenylosuccinate synthase